MLRAADHLETLTCCSPEADLARVLSLAIGLTRSQPGALVLLSEAKDSLPRESNDSLIRDLRAARVPLHLVVLGNGGDGLQDLEMIVHDSGGRRIKIATEDVSAVRKMLAEPIASEGVYFIALNGRFGNATIALAKPRLEERQ